MKPTGPFLEVVSGEPDAEVEQLLGAARAWAEPSSDNRERVAAALRAAVPVALPAIAPAASISSGASAAALRVGVASTRAPRANATGARLPWLLVGGALLGAIGFWLGHGVGYQAGQREAARAAELSGPDRGALASAVEPAPAVAGSPAAARTSAGAPLLEPAMPADRSSAMSPTVSTPASVASRAEPSARARPTPRATAAAAAESSRALAEPARLSFRQVLDQLRRAQQQLRSGQATMSLLLLSELDRAAGDVLLEERNATRVLALCAAGQEQAARDVARRLARDSPRSIYGMRLEASCIGDAASLEPSAP